MTTGRITRAYLEDCVTEKIYELTDLINNPSTIKTIGRDPKSDVPISPYVTEVSRRHARVSFFPQTNTFFIDNTSHSGQKLTLSPHPGEHEDTLPIECRPCEYDSEKNIDESTCQRYALCDRTLISLSGNCYNFIYHEERVG